MLRQLYGTTNGLLRDAETSHMEQRQLQKALADTDAVTIIGGGDSAAAVKPALDMATR